MRVLTIATRKGGSGKSTIGAALAAAAAQGGARVAVLDLDVQGSLTEWHSRREARDVDLISLRREPVSQALPRLVQQQGHDFLLIDTPGDFGPEITTAISVATIVLVPVRPTVVDLAAVSKTVESIKILEKKLVFVLSQTNTRSRSRTEEVSMALRAHGLVAPVEIVSRTDYQDAFLDGQGPTEYFPNGKAAEEVKQLWSYLRRVMPK